jgi:hypothetical protein
MLGIGSTHVIVTENMASFSVRVAHKHIKMIKIDIVTEIYHDFSVSVTLHAGTTAASTQNCLSNQAFFLSYAKRAKCKLFLSDWITRRVENSSWRQ